MTQNNIKLRSMTGYGLSEKSLQNGSVKCEIKSLNGKFSEVNIRLPRILNNKEIEIKKTISEQLQRGSIQVFVTLDKNEVSDTKKLFNEKLILQYHSEMKRINNANGMNDNDWSKILLLPDVLKKEDAEELSEEDLKTIRSCVLEACQHVNDFRLDEGRDLYKELSELNEKIRENLSKLKPFETERVEQIKIRIKSQLNELLEKSEKDNIRLEQEMIYYIEKLDISEEKQRLANHCNYFDQILNEETSGKKLGFIAQEIGREINTIGSKSNHFNMQQLVVNMKDELEKMKEQLSNVL